MKDPERLRVGLQRLIEDEQKKAMRHDPTHELRHWQGELEKIERMRSGYLDQQAEGMISMAELKGKLVALNERRTVAERELEKLTRHQERIAELERDAEALMELYRHQAREGLDLYTPQDRHDAYKTLGIKVIAHPDGTIELTGNVLADAHSDSTRSKPIERSHYERVNEVAITLRETSHSRRLQVDQDPDQTAYSLSLTLGPREL